MEDLKEKNKINQYLQDYHAGKISMGLDTGLRPLDDAIRFKSSQLTIINGLDNVGKTIWMLWYFLLLSKKHGLKWCIYSGENKSGQLVRQLIQFLTGVRLEDMKLSEVFHYELMIGQWFTFIDNTEHYKLKDLTKIFEDGNYDGCLIDPYTGLDRKYTHEGNYDFLNDARHFCNRTGKSLYVNTHVVSEAARRTYSEGHEYANHPYPPNKSQSEGGQPFGNRTDDFITIHRLTAHATRRYITEIFIRKIKDHETGGSITPIDEPLEFQFNNGLGFTMHGQNPLTCVVTNDDDLKDLEINKDFETEGQDVNTDIPF